jgi:hypothetical protein
MDTERIKHAQGFLQVESIEGRKRILDLECLLSLHAPQIVIGLLDELIKDNKVKLRRLLKRDKSDPRVDHTLSRLFRLKMSRATLNNGIQKVQEAA